MMTHSRIEMAIGLTNITKHFGIQPVIDNLTLSISRGELFGLLGPSGSGKTTLIRIITGIDEADTGQITMFGETIPQLRMLESFGYMAQADALYAELTGRQNMEFFGSLYGLRGEHLRSRIKSTASIVQVTDHLGKQVGAYSGGMKRRLSLAIALLHEPQLLILDEPTVGIDPVLRQSIWQELTALREQGITIIVTTHVMDEASHCDRLGLIREGKLIAVGTPDGIIQEAGCQTLEDAFVSLAHSGGMEQ